MIPREKVLVAIPSYDSRIDLACITGLFQTLPYYHRPFFWSGCSSIPLARNEIANLFLEKFTSYDWLMMIDSDTGFTLEDWQLFWEGDEQIVVAEYARKIIGEKPVSFGLGFCRVHRSVFQAIKDLQKDTENGKEDKVPRFYHQGQVMVDYFPSGVIQDGRWVGEDRGFFLWCSDTHCTMREEKRLKLKHIGRFEYGYPDQIEGFSMVDELPTQ